MTQTGEAKDPQAALNGAQVTALVGVIESVATGRLPRDTAVQVIVASFSIDAAQANKILGTVGRGFKPAEEEGKA